MRGLLLALLFAIPACGQTPTLVNQARQVDTGFAGINSATATGCNPGISNPSDYYFCFPEPTLASNIGVAACYWDHSGTTTATVSDDQSSTWTEIKKQAHTGGADIDIFTSPMATSVHQVKLHLSGTRTHVACEVSQWMNTDGTSCGTAVGANPSGTALSAGNITSSVTNCLYVQGVVVDDGFGTQPSWTAGSGFTLLTAVKRIQYASQYQVYGTAASHACSITASASVSGPSACIALKPASQGTASSGMFVQQMFQYPFRDGIGSVADQAPCAGCNLLVVSYNGDNGDTFTGVSTANPSVTCTNVGGGTAHASNTEGVQYMYYCPGTFLSTTTITFTISTSNSNSDVMVYGIVGGNATQPDPAGLFTDSFTVSSFTSPVSTLSMTPTGSSKGIAFVNCGIALNGSTSGNPPGYQDNQNNNNFWGHYKYTSSATQNWDMSLDQRSAPGGAGDCSCAGALIIETVAVNSLSPSKVRKLAKYDF